MEDFEVEYAAQVTSTSINNHGTTPELTLEATTQTEDSTQTEEVMINTPEPPFELTVGFIQAYINLFISLNYASLGCI